MVLEKIHILTCSFFLNCVSVSSSYMNDVYYNFVYRVLRYIHIFYIIWQDDTTLFTYNMTVKYDTY